MYLKNTFIFLIPSFSILEAYFSLLDPLRRVVGCIREKKKPQKKQPIKSCLLSLSQTEPIKIDTSLINRIHLLSKYRVYFLYAFNLHFQNHLHSACGHEFEANAF